MKVTSAHKNASQMPLAKNSITLYKMFLPSQKSQLAISKVLPAYLLDLFLNMEGFLTNTQSRGLTLPLPYTST